MRAIVYLRISSDRTGLAAGVARQREDCLQRCADRGWDVVAVEADNDVSASTGRHRPGFEAVLTAIESGEAHVIVAWAVDRLQRSRRDEARLYELCQARGAMVSLVKGSDLDFSTAAGRYVADALGSVARMETEMKSERQKRATLQAAHAGRRTGGRRPFGYDDDGLTIREPEAQAVRDAYRAFLAGVPLGAIARTWNAAGLTTGQARWKGDHAGEPSLWRRDNVRAVLSNPRNAGLRAHLGEVVGPAVWPALVDESTFHAVAAVLRDPGRSTGPRSSRALLSGLALCATCGLTVHGGGGRTGVRTIRCSSNKHFARRAEPIEQYVESYLIALLSRPDAVELMIDHDAPDLDALRVEATALRSRLDALATEFADGELTAGQVRTATERIRSKIASNDARMADAGRVDVLGALLGAADVEGAWAALSMARKRAVIATLYRVRIAPAGRGRTDVGPQNVFMDRLTD